MTITAKVRCTSKQEFSHEDPDKRYASLGFGPDYTEGRNAEWAAATPHLDLRMTVRGDVGDRFELGKPYTLTFEPEVSED